MDSITTIPPQDPLATNRLGEIAVTKVLLRALEKGVVILKPTIECRYDLVIDDGLKLYRAQVKYAGGACPKQCQGAVTVGLSKWRNGGRSVTLYYTASEIDVILVYVRAIDKILWFGPEVFEGRTKLHIRLEPSRNNQRKGCLMAADYIW
jgi:hypothetical protein